MAKYIVPILVILFLAGFVGCAQAANGCLVVQNVVIDHGYTGSLSFTVDLINSGGTVVQSLTFTGKGLKAFTNVPPGDYTVVEQDPGPAWKVTKKNTAVHIASGQQCSQANTITIANEYNYGCLIVSKVVVPHGYTGPMSFTVDLRNAGGVVQSLTFTGMGQQVFNNILPGGYTVTERDPGPAWKLVTANNVPVRIDAGMCDQAKTITFGNEYQDACIFIKKVVLDHGYNGPMSFAVDLKDSRGSVVNTLTFTGAGTQAFNDLLSGDYTVAERDPGSSWKALDNNIPVRIAKGEICSPEKNVTISNEYIPAVCVDDLKVQGDSCGTPVHLSWTTTGADHYNIYRGTIAGGPSALVGSAKTGSFDDPGASTGETLYYTVAPADTSDKESCHSNEVSVRLTGSCVPEFPVPILPVVLITGFLVTVLLIRRTREQ